MLETKDTVKSIGRPDPHVPMGRKRDIKTLVFL